MADVRVAVVTGGTGALGRSVVARLLGVGYRVWVPWVREGEARALESEIASPKLCLRRAGLTSEPDVKQFFEAVDAAEGHLDALANIAGGFAAAPLEKTDATAWRDMMDLNATTAFLCCRYALPLMRGPTTARIVNVASGPAVNRGAAGMSAYSASKAAVLNLTESLAKELAGRVTVNALVPTVIDTPANRRAMPRADTSSWLSPVEIARVIEFLLGDAAAIVTGTAVCLSKG